MNLNRVRVKEAMDIKGIATYAELAALLGITKNRMSVMLSDTYSPIKARVRDLCALLQISPTELLELETVPQSVSQTEQNNPTPASVTAIELFAGAGGLALGLEKAGIDTVAYVEIDKFCCETLKKNRPHWNVIGSDISGVDFTKYKHKVDIVTGGFPCQAFSYAGKKNGVQGHERNIVPRVCALRK
jgi:DNA (cytosine-5)-methyltransferase 1